MLKLLPQYKSSPILRSRKGDELAQCHIVVDVGGEYNDATRRYDHHQRGFFETVDGEAGVATDAASATGRFKTKLSACGLVYKHYGRDVLTQIACSNGVELDAALLEVIYAKIYSGFVEHIDGIDNGIEAFDGERNYSVSTTLSARVGQLNPSWNEAAPKGDSGVEGSEMERFRRAMALTLGEFTGAVERLLNGWLPARAIVEGALKDRTAVHASGKVLRLPQFCPWKGHLFDLEKEGELCAKGEVFYVLYGDSGGKWRIQAVPEAPDSFTSRRALPAKLCGLRDEALSAASGIEGCVFIHNSGFIGGNVTYEGALAMANLALKDEV